MTQHIFQAFWRRKILLAALMASLLVSIYWLLVATDRYVSSAHVIIQRTDLPGGSAVDVGALLSGVASGGNRADQLLLRDHLLSVDMLQKLDKQLNLRAHYSQAEVDLVSRMWGADRALEHFHKHYLGRVTVEMDDYAGVLVVQAQAYDAAMAQAIVRALVKEGEAFMNRLAQDLAQAQVTFLEEQVKDMNARAMQARQALLAFQNEKGLVSPQATAESLGAIVAQLESRRAELETQRSGLLAYLVADHPSILLLNQQIAAVEKQLTQEQQKLASPKGATLNRTVEAYQRLEMEATFAQKVYQTALAALEKGRIEATRTIKKVQVMQAPTLAEYPLQPKRLYNALIFTLFAFVLAGVAHLVLAIVRDHKD